MPAGAAADEETNSSSSDSSIYLVSTSDPEEVATQLGVSEAKLIGGNVVGSLRFESRDCERSFLASASHSFSFPLLERRLMRTGVPNMLQCAEDLALKSLVASRCAAWQLRAEGMQSSRAAELEERIAALEKEKADLQASLASARSEVDATSKQLTEACQRASAAEEEAKKVEERRTKTKETLGRFCEVIASGAELLQADIHNLLERFGLTPPELSEEDNVGVAELFRWLRVCVAMADTGSLFYGDLSAAIAARALSASVCGLLLADSGNSGSITKAQLRTLCDRSFQWPSAEAMRPEVLPALPNNIAKNFAETFFRERGRGLVQLEGECLKEQLQAKAEAWAREVVGDAAARDLPDSDPKAASGSAEGDDGRGAGDGAPGEV
ncbi:uncharacterized protein LOC120640649 [Panicum virgatum]|uniref:Uncharacterized protein n=1 Tax=Panicum virgatum TaxID=38727 RepID=A0A8T0QF57_PANVG|nr:uncharacterized protein LOC120640649 [Panicum virgatum]KAG2571459.1 hypothetical protein PVAP13_7KG111110 [Panicum virgatum]